MEIITSAQYHQQHIESRKQYQVVYNTEGYDRIVRYSDRYVTGSYREVQLRHGVHLVLYDGTCLRDLSVENLFDTHQWIVARFHLAGISRIVISGNQDKSFKADYIHQADVKSQGNNFIADIKNAQLFLPSGNKFSKQQPAQGITTVTATNLYANTIRLIVTGEALLPVVELYDSPREGLVFGVASAAASGQLGQILGL